MPKAINYTGKIFNRLTAIKFTEKYTSTSGGNKKRIWLFQCSCGKLCEKVMEKVVKKHVQSCGCLKSTRSPQEVVQHAVYQDSYQDGNLTPEQFLHLSQQPCWWCNSPPSNTRYHRYDKSISFTYNGLDRIDPNNKHDDDNVVPCCWDCNEMRKKRTIPNFLMKIQAIYNNRIKQNDQT